MNKEKIQIRKTIIKLHQKGKSQLEISGLLDIPQTTISFWIRRYKEKGSLENLSKSGRPAYLTKDQLYELKKHLLNYAPERYGGESLGWTTKTAIDFIKNKYNVKYSMRRMQELFHKFGLSLITPRSEAYKGSKLARDSYRDEFKKKAKMNIWVPKSSILMR
jgi:transposase